MEEFRAAMLDPERFVLASAAGRRAHHGGGRSAGGPAAASRRPVGERADRAAAGCRCPPTFGHGAGELLDEDFAPPRSSRKGLVVGALLAAAVAGVAAVFYVKQQSASPDAGRGGHA